MVYVMLVRHVRIWKKEDGIWRYDVIEWRHPHPVSSDRSVCLRVSVVVRLSALPDPVLERAVNTLTVTERTTVLEQELISYH